MLRGSATFFSFTIHSWKRSEPNGLRIFDLKPLATIAAANCNACFPKNAAL